MASRLVITVQDDKLQEVKKAIIGAVGNVVIEAAVIINNIDDDNATKAAVAASAAGATCAAFSEI